MRPYNAFNKNKMMKQEKVSIQLKEEPVVIMEAQKKVLNNKYYFLLFFVLLSNIAYSQNNNDDTLSVYVIFNYKAKYQFMIKNEVYEYCNYIDSISYGFFRAFFPKDIQTDRGISIRVKRKNKIKWEYCIVNVKNKLVGNHIILYQDYLYRESCFKIVYSDDSLSLTYKTFIDDKIQNNFNCCNPIKITHVERGWSYFYR